MERHRASAEQKIREAQAQGLFDNLPGAGKPLDLGNVNDPDWFAKSLVRREKIDPELLMHPTIALRREAETYPEALADLRTEEQVREVLEDFNARVKAEWRRPQIGPSLPVIARSIDVERMVARWHELRGRREAEARAAAAELVAAAPQEVPRVRRRWRLRRRGRAS